ncbi:2-nitropropane dioxygenase [Skermanella stibiiresistens SB22]|uniref:2-nitropropane dioxygenase n=1 Tax=Skermanella stibiiresistens SB22 TaxID=1385369 RepID=W9H8F4_9PROT|nr:nitronate monooxygenase [Skermanella stibiiresistens]EWY40967.1 2-nitropropane dioxygenase [Skermanella stibiiresistens SB22]
MTQATAPTPEDDRTRAARARLDRLWSRGRAFLGTELAIMGGAMTWVSERNLVAAISNGGAFGVIASGSMTPDQLQAEILGTRALTSRPFGVNLITLHPRLDDLIDVCAEHRVSHIVLAGGLPSSASIRRAKDRGAKVVGFAPAASIARKLVKNGADAILIEGMEAGGHIGPVATSVLAQEILPVVNDVPVFVAGGIGRGEAILSYLEMGAAGVQLGTRFVCATESVAHPRYKQAFINAAARDAVPSVQIDPRFPVIPVRALNNEGTRRFQVFQREVIDRFNRGEVSQKDAQLEIEHFWAGALRRAVIEGDVENGSLMAGQSVGMVTREQPAAEILGELVDQAIRSLMVRLGGPEKPEWRDSGPGDLGRSDLGRGQSGMMGAAE